MSDFGVIPDTSSLSGCQRRSAGRFTHLKDPLSSKSAITTFILDKNELNYLLVKDKLDVASPFDTHVLFH